MTKESIIKIAEPLINQGFKCGESDQEIAYKIASNIFEEEQAIQMQTGVKQLLEAQVIKKIADVIKDAGETEYKYYAIPCKWTSGRGRREGYHNYPITGWETYEISREEWLKNKHESEMKEYEAFMGRYKMSYTKYKRQVSKAGWREKLIKWLEDDSNFSL
jgi:hypothetical protein